MVLQAFRTLFSQKRGQNCDTLIPFARIGRNCGNGLNLGFDMPFEGTDDPAQLVRPSGLNQVEAGFNKVTPDSSASHYLSRTEMPSIKIRRNTVRRFQPLLVLLEEAGSDFAGDLLGAIPPPIMSQQEVVHEAISDLLAFRGCKSFDSLGRKWLSEHRQAEQKFAIG